MNSSEHICPYTGLRSFSEDESLYFKGRDEQILQVTSQLQLRKFLMVTGASGDGKSSLIFAGLIPQAKAGFFKARYSNWQVADFRPERSPIRNMATALSRALNFDTETIEVELSRGFSSLVDLYKTSDRFADQTSSAWSNADEEGRQQMERQSSNLIILIDQFEEFFTNPENFPGGVPSQEARLLMNIILETAKIALKEDLPIYIICTMRSDYIGQCAAFRGLPEFIGFSQFFVPRLQRKELYQIIEEPAVLSGNRISKRLIERLIVDVELETDQLPILQHALKEIWKAADSGNKEMDLIHYAMVGGMDGEKLPSESIEEFQTWKKSLDDQQLTFLESPGLANVLDIHANKLFNQSAEYCQKIGFPQIQDKDARFILAMTFACLTRIDENRAVRNRMTLEEITSIINVPKYDSKTVGAVLSVFRLSENTLVRPYVEDQDQLKDLDKDSVLDITHEALIRNWKKLRDWANQEYEYYNTFLDFNQQVNRWKDHGKSNDFLLPIGPLTYFEDWYKNCRPNKYWISRYNTHEPDKDIRLKDADGKLKDGKEFLRKSSLQLYVTRTVMKYGAGKITALVAGFLILILASVVFYNWRIRQNDYVVESILEETQAFVADREIVDLDLAYYLSCVEHYKPGSFSSNLEKMPFELKVNTSLNFLNNFLFADFKTVPAVVKQNLVYADSLLSDYQSLMDPEDISSVMQYMGWKTRLIRNLFLYDFFWPDVEIVDIRNKNIPHLANLVFNAFSLEEQMSQIDFKELHIGLTLALNMRGLNDDQIRTLINKMSPFENSASKKFFDKWFPSGRTIPVGFGTNISHNGGYQTLAYLYASIGEPQLAIRSVDSLRKYNRSYNQFEDGNSLNIVPYFLIYGKEEALGEFADLDASRMNVHILDYLNQVFMKSGVNDTNTGVGLFRAVNMNDNYLLIDAERRLTLFQIIYRKILESDLTPNESNFKLALLFKLSGILEDKYSRVKKWNATQKTDSLFETALQYYQSVDPEFLEEKVEKELQVWIFQQSEKRTLKRKDLFTYPGYRKEAIPPIRMSEFNYYSDGFFQFLFKKGLLKDFYESREDYVLMNEWISTYFQWYDGSGDRAHIFSIYPGTIAKVDSMLSNSGFVLENAWTKMKLAMDFFEEGDTTNAFQSVEDIYIETFNKTRNSFYFQNMVIQVAMECAIRGRLPNAMSLIGNFNSGRNRITAYSAIASACYSNEKFSLARSFYDSALVEMNKLEDLGGEEFDDFRVELVRYLALQNSDESMALAFEYIGSMDWAARTWGIRIMGYSLGSLGNYYDAWNLLPENSSGTDRIRLATDAILLFENKKLARPEWKEILKSDELWQQFVRTENDLTSR